MKFQTKKEGVDKRVHFLGSRSDHIELLKAADIYVQAHNYTAEGNVWKGPNTSQMEACAAGVPSVSTAVPLIDTLIEDGVTGILARPNDPFDLARAITFLCEHPDDARRFAQAARVRVEERYSVSKMVNAYEELYENVNAFPKPVSIVTFANLGKKTNLPTADIVPAINVFADTGELNQIICQINKDFYFRNTVSAVPAAIRYFLKFFEKLSGISVPRRTTETLFDYFAQLKLEQCELCFLHGVCRKRLKKREKRQYCGGNCQDGAW